MDTATHTELVADLRRLVRVKLIDPLAILLGDDGAPLHAVHSQLDIHAEVWAAQLLDGDDVTATHTAARLIAALYPDDAAFDPPRHWWSTPLGRAIARRCGHPAADAVSAATAAAMLGISRQGVADLLARDKLARHVSGGVESDSIRQRLRRNRDKPSDRPDSRPRPNPDRGA